MARFVIRTIGALAAALALLAVGASTALAADSLNIALTTSMPVRGIPITVTFSGTATPYDTRGTTPSLYALVRPASGGPCQATFGADLQVSGSTGVTEIYGPDANQEQPAVSSGTYSYPASVTPVAGSYIVCAWLETDSNDYNGKGDTAAIVTASATATYTTQNTDKLGIALPTTSPTKGIPMTITFAGNATPYDTRGTTPSLYALVRPASGGPCQATFGADLQVSGSTGVTEIYGPDANQEQPAVSSGTYSYSASVTPVASSYIVCAWLETDADDYKGKGDTAAIVTATATASYSVPLPVECVVPSFAGTRLAGIKRKLATNHCGIGQVRSVRRRHTQRGQVIGLSARPGSRHPDGYRVEITVSKGP